MKEITSRDGKCYGEMERYRKYIESNISKSGNITDRARKAIEVRIERQSKFGRKISDLLWEGIYFGQSRRLKIPRVHSRNAFMDLQLPKFTENMENSLRHYLRDSELDFKDVM